MPCNNAPTAEHLIYEIRELARLFEELTDSVHEIDAELTQLQEQLGVKELRITERLVARPFRAPTNKPN